jgi:hypothetical protein
VGFIQNVLHKLPDTKRPPRSDAFLLVLALQIMTRSHGEPPEEKVALLESFTRTLPGLDDAQFVQLTAQAKALIENHAASVLASSGRTESEDIPEPEQPTVILHILLPLIDELSAIRSTATRERCLLLSLELASVRGYVDEHDEKLLERMLHVLGIDREIAKMMTEIALLKYLPA